MTIQTNTNNRKAMVAAIAQHVGQVQRYQAAPSFSYTIGSITVAKDGSITGSDEDLRALLPFLMEQGYVETNAQSTGQEVGTDEKSASAERIEHDSQLSIQELCGGDDESDHPAADAADDAADADDTAGGVENNPTLIQELVQENPDQASNELRAESDTDAERQTDDSQTTTGQSEIDSVVITLGNVELTPRAATNLLFTLYSQQYLLNRAFGEETLSISDQLVARIQEQPVTTMDEFLSITGKAAESGELKGVDFGAGTFGMAFPADAAEPERRNMYVQLMHQLIKHAIVSTRAMPKLLKPDAEKYFLHSWLLRIGCDGPDFKALRKRLLSGLNGYCAFPDEEHAQRHKDRYKRIRQNRRAAREGSQSSADGQSGEDDQNTRSIEGGTPDGTSSADETNEEAEAI